MKVAVALVAVVVVALTEATSWKTCGSSSYVKVKKLDITPDTLKFPGDVSYDVEVEFLKQVKDVSMSVRIERHTFFLDIRLPCVKNVGSCSYNKMCTFVDDMIRENWGGVGAKIGAQVTAGRTIPSNLCQTGVPVSTLKNKGTLAIPKLPTILSFITAGDYTVKLQFTDNATGANVACVEVDATLKKA